MSSESAGAVKIKAELSCSIGPVHLGVFGKSAHLPAPNPGESRSIEREFLTLNLGIRAENIFFLKQTHGDRIWFVDEGALSSENYFREGDALFTDSHGYLLCVRTADCLPLFFVLQKTEAGREVYRTGIIHAGWRGLHSRIVEKCLSQASLEFFKNSSDGRCTILAGPCIGEDSYEVDQDVGSLFEIKKPGPGGKYLLGLEKNALVQLESGLKVNFKILPVLGACTFQDNTNFYSHRRGDTGRNLNYIYIDPLSEGLNLK